MARLGIKKLHYYELVRRKSLNELLKGLNIRECDLSILITGKYITEDHYGFSVNQLVKRSYYGFDTVRFSVKRLKAGKYIIKVKESTGHFKKRYSALWALTFEGEELIRRYNVKCEYYLNKAIKYEYK